MYLFTALTSLRYVRSEDFTTVTKKNAVFWDVTLYGSCRNRRFGAERIASIGRGIRFDELEKLAVTNNRSTLRKNAIYTVLRNVDSYKGYTV
jgi:hypothetical protein